MFKTPIIIRETEKGNVIALCPTMPGSLENKNLCQMLNSKGNFTSKPETYESFMARTSEVSESQKRKFLKLVTYEGTYYSVGSETVKMRQLRLGDVHNNPEFVGE